MMYILSAVLVPLIGFGLVLCLPALFAFLIGIRHDRMIRRVQRASMRAQADYERDMEQSIMDVIKEEK